MEPKQTTEQAHTPGPWRVLLAEAEHPYLRVRGTRPGSRYKVANVHAGYASDALSDAHNARESAETTANAHLIAAAPELLAALQKIASSSRNEDGCYYTNRANISIAAAAIAKVKA